MLGHVEVKVDVEGAGWDIATPPALAGTFLHSEVKFNHSSWRETLSHVESRGTTSSSLSFHHTI